jgi:hypothetical protein
LLRLNKNVCLFSCFSSRCTLDIQRQDALFCGSHLANQLIVGAFINSLIYIIVRYWHSPVIMKIHFCKWIKIKIKYEILALSFIWTPFAVIVHSEELLIL